MNQEASANLDKMLKASGFTGVGKLADTFFRYLALVAMARLITGLALPAMLAMGVGRLRNGEPV